MHMKNFIACHMYSSHAQAGGLGSRLGEVGISVGEEECLEDLAGDIQRQVA